jgi:hypothetical protein
MRWITSKFRNKTAIERKRPAILLAIVLLGAGGLLATADSANRIVPRLQIFPDSDGAFATLNLGGPTNSYLLCQCCCTPTTRPLNSNRKPYLPGFER